MRQTDRRAFLKGMAGVAALGAGGCFSLSPSVRDGHVRLAVIGQPGRGFAMWSSVVATGEALLAAASVGDAGQWTRFQERLCVPGSAADLSDTFLATDEREIIDNLVDLHVDALIVTAADCSPVPVVLEALRLGVPVLVEPPIAFRLHELDELERTARAADVGVTVNMGLADDAPFQRALAVVRSGLLGDVRDVHVWTSAPYWPQGAAVGRFLAAPASDRDALSSSVDRRASVASGLGALGVSGSELLRLPVEGLSLGPVFSAECFVIEGSHPLVYPNKSAVRLAYPSRTLTWYDGGEVPEMSLVRPYLPAFDGRLPSQGVLMVGSKGTLFQSAPGQEALIALKGERRLRSVTVHPATSGLVRQVSPSPSASPMRLFLDAVQKGSLTFDERSFARIRRLEEAVLVATLAQRLPGKTLKWDGRLGRFELDVANELI